MARSLALPLFVTLAASLVACTALLGDFSVDPNFRAGDGADAGDSGPDVGADAPADGPVGPPLMKCGVNGSPVNLVTGIVGSDRLGLHAFKGPNGDKRRVMYSTNASTNVNFVTIDDNLTMASISNQPFDLGANPQALASYDGGFAAFGVSSKTFQHIVGLRFDDSALAPSDVIGVTAAGDLPLSVSDFSIAAAPIGGDEFFVIYTYSSGVNVWTMYAGHAHLTLGATQGPFKLVSSTITARPSLSSDLLVIDKPDNLAVLFMEADKGQGPASVVQLDLTTASQIGATQTLQAIHGSSTFGPLSAQTDILPGVDKVGLAFLEFDLNNPNQPIYAYALALPVVGFGGFKLAALPPPVSFMDVADIAVDKGRAFWRHFPGAGSHVVEAARGTQTGKGVNFLWFDGAGNLRGKASGSTALVPSDVVSAAAGTLLDAPTTVIATASVTWMTDTGTLRIANVGCAK